eukprot:TRINITY_DN2219_c2_g3_i1.p1 TRINITY_DN2219_c2_g3~~TRINITY_DN2219_c2_g3_i1.p1  ORF type:complete len:393 (+),score=110.52 TRINITY_DN2219_c2_g3_i1:46-1224(+)
MSDILELGPSKRKVTFQVGSGKTFDLGIKVEGNVKVVFRKDLSSVHAFISGDNPVEVLAKLTSAVGSNDGQSLLEVFEPKLNPKDLAEEKQRELAGKKIHSYEIEGSLFEVYTGTVRELKYISKRMQFFISQLTDGIALQEDFDADGSHAFYTVRRTGDTWEIVGYANADEEYLFPDTEQLVIHQLCVLPVWQRQGHGSVLTACIWKRAETLEMKRVTWEPLQEQSEEGADNTFDFDGFARPVHLSRMIKKGIFLQYDAAPLRGDAYTGNPNCTEWEKIRVAKRAAYDRSDVDVKKLVWTRQGAELAASTLLLPVNSVRELFEVSLLKKDRSNADVAKFIKVRLFLMDRIRMAVLTAAERRAELQKCFDQTYQEWQRSALKASALRNSKILP